MVELQRKLVRFYVFEDALSKKFRNLIKSQILQDESYGLPLVVFMDTHRENSMNEYGHLGRWCIKSTFEMFLN